MAPSDRDIPFFKGGSGLVESNDRQNYRPQDSTKENVMPSGEIPHRNSSSGVSAKSHKSEKSNVSSHKSGSPELFTTANNSPELAQDSQTQNTYDQDEVIDRDGTLQMEYSHEHHGSSASSSAQFRILQTDDLYDTEVTESSESIQDFDYEQVIEQIQTPSRASLPGLQQVTPISLDHRSNSSFRFSGHDFSLTPGATTGSIIHSPIASPQRRRGSRRSNLDQSIGHSAANPPPRPLRPIENLNLPARPQNRLVFGKPRTYNSNGSNHANVIYPTTEMYERATSNGTAVTAGSNNSNGSRATSASSLEQSMRQACEYPISALRQPTKESLKGGKLARPILAGLPDAPVFPAGSVTIKDEKFDHWGRRQCPTMISVLALIACTCFPPFWLLMGSGFFDSLLGVIPRRIKQVALALGTAALAAAIALSIVFCLV